MFCKLHARQLTKHAGFFVLTVLLLPLNLCPFMFDPILHVYRCKHFLTYDSPSNEVSCLLVVVRGNDDSWIEPKDNILLLKPLGAKALTVMN